MNKVRAGNELQDAIRSGSNKSDYGTVPITDKTDDKHGKERNRTAVWKRWQFDHDGYYSGERQSHSTENKLFGCKFTF